ncbi:MAG TPA: hypothetical protein PKD69_05115, partial [Elusimicrobiota bacterium]|nr:hypothetical protein [Elusimicrobiota bacterium]
MNRVRGFFLLILGMTSPGTPHALTPLPDGSPAFFAGEWMGGGEHGGTCYLSLNADGSGTVMVDAGAGDWLGARLQWKNDRQSLQIVKTVPLPAAPRVRLGPLTNYTLSAGMNQSLRLAWNGSTCGCQLQKIETTARQLARAREALKAL